VPQAAGFWSGDSFGRIRERKEFDYILSIEFQIKLVGLPWFPIDLPDDFQAQDLRVETLGTLKIRANDGDVVEGAEI